MRALRLTGWEVHVQQAEQNLPKPVATACARALLEGIAATPSRDDRGQATVILCRGPWVREVTPEQIGDALAEAREVRA